VRTVVGEDGAVLQRYPIQIEQAADAAAVYAVNQGLVQVMARGTGRSVLAQLPQGLNVAGKTGTSDDLRDSWFAGFTNDHLIVAWLGADDNRPIGLTGSSGAARIWARVMGALEADSYDAPLPATLAAYYVHYETGTPVAEGCAGAVFAPLPADSAERVFGCDGATGFGARIRRWFDKDDR
jgi:penicillin-binding protein 1B